MTNSLILLRSPAAQQFRNKAGDSNYRLNTIVVGLEGVKSGNAILPADMTISWRTSNAELAAQKARGFATESVMVYVLDAFDTYLKTLVRFPGIISDTDFKSVFLGEFQTDMSDAVPVENRNIDELITSLRGNRDQLERDIKDFIKRHFGVRKKPSIRVRLDKLLTLTDAVPNYYKAAFHLLISWRNRHVHGDANDVLSVEMKNFLVQAKDFFYQNHGHLDVERLLENYEKNNSPTLKEISTLISVLHRVVATCDEAILNSLNIEDYAHRSLAFTFKNMDNPQKYLKKCWGKSIDSRIRKLSAILNQHGFRRMCNAQPNAGKSLPSEFLEDFSSKSYEDIEVLLGID